MSEAELLLLASESLDRMWSLIQWWASISFGILALTHIASDKLGTFLAILIPALYTGFSLGVLGVVQRNFGIVESVYQDLRLLQSEGVDLSGTAQYVMQGGENSIARALPLILALTYFGVVGYFAYTYRAKNKV